MLRLTSVAWRARSSSWFCPLVMVAWAAAASPPGLGEPGPPGDIARPGRMAGVAIKPGMGVEVTCAPTGRFAHPIRMKIIKVTIDNAAICRTLMLIIYPCPVLFPVRGLWPRTGNNTGLIFLTPLSPGIGGKGLGDRGLGPLIKHPSSTAPQQADQGEQDDGAAKRHQDRLQVDPIHFGPQVEQIGGNPTPQQPADHADDDIP